MVHHSILSSKVQIQNSDVFMLSQEHGLPLRRQG